uniref:Uncharacterized protein n=1 Tax=Steinernema glaseri TaxID=37863 RepID=A0A1I8A8U7_9BILA
MALGNCPPRGPINACVAAADRNVSSGSLSRGQLLAPLSYHAPIFDPQTAVPNVCRNKFYEEVSAAKRKGLERNRLATAKGNKLNDAPRSWTCEVARPGYKFENLAMVLMAQEAVNWSDNK